MQLRIEELQQKYQPKGFDDATIVERRRPRDKRGDSNVVLILSLNEEPGPEENKGEVPH